MTPPTDGFPPYPEPSPEQPARPVSADSPRSPWRARALVGVAVLFAIGAIVIGVRMARYREAIRGPLVQEAYLWQRVWTPEVQESLQKCPGVLDGLLVLASQVSWEEGNLKKEPFSPDYSLLAGLSLPVGLTLRMGGFPGRFSESPQALGALIRHCSETLSRATEAGISVSEFQVDFDCPESKLGDYAFLMRELRKNLPALPLTVTALPSWLDQSSFRDLARQTDRYVLQVHSLKTPSRVDEPSALFDPAASRRWIREAEGVGVPFWLALPTYGYRLTFDETGKYRGISAENSPKSLSEGWQIRELRTDPADLAAFVRQLSERHPKLLQGLIWFRLPVEQDRLNWRWETFVSVLRGEVPEGRLTATSRWDRPGLLTVGLSNRGEKDVPLPPSVRVEWDSGILLAADGLGGYRFRPGSGQTLSFEIPTEGPSAQGTPKSLPAGYRFDVGWIGFEGEREVEVRLDVRDFEE